LFDKVEEDIPDQSLPESKSEPAQPEVPIETEVVEIPKPYVMDFNDEAS